MPGRPEFIDEVDKQRSKGNFDKIVNDGENLNSEPQLGTEVKEVEKRNGKVPVEKLNHHRREQSAHQRPALRQL